MNTQNHNPDNLTEWGQSEGWRLLTVEERKGVLPEDVQFYDDGAWFPSDSGGRTSQNEWRTYRTREPLPSQPSDDLSYYETELPKVIAGVRRGEKWEYLSFNDGTWHQPLNVSMSGLEAILVDHCRVRLAPVPVVKPWTFNTRPREIVWVYKKGFISDRLITAWKDDGVEIGSYAFVTYDQLLAEWLQRDGTPCGDCVKPEGSK